MSIIAGCAFSGHTNCVCMCVCLCVFVRKEMCFSCSAIGLHQSPAVSHPHREFHVLFLPLCRLFLCSSISAGFREANLFRLFQLLRPVLYAELYVCCSFVFDGHRFSFILYRQRRSDSRRGRSTLKGE